jgi:predicted CoA-substrate-specific enzyme activase
MRVFLGIDLGSVSTNIAVVDETGMVLETVYLRTRGRPIAAIQEALSRVRESGRAYDVAGAGTTGSGRQLAGVIVGADCVKNEITAHAVAAMHVAADVRTVIEIGGQDSKIILLKDGIVSDFAMNTVCAAGTGSFLDQQAARLGLAIEDFGRLALAATAPVRVAGRCAVFAESDMIHKQQSGHQLADIIGGLCQALVRNYLSNVGKGKHIEGPVLFQGGVAANPGMKKAFEEALGLEVIVPPHFGVMGAIGAALLAKEEVAGRAGTAFRGFGLVDQPYRAAGLECGGCANACEVVELKLADAVLARWGDRCGKWSAAVGRPATGDSPGSNTH